MPVTAAEYELLCRVVQDDRAAFDALDRQYFHPVYCNAIKITRDKEAAEDILQEVFITLWERNTVSLEQSIGGWLFVLSYNRSINLLRKKLRESLAYQLLQEPIADDRVDETKYHLQFHEQLLN